MPTQALTKNISALIEFLPVWPQSRFSLNYNSEDLPFCIWFLFPPYPKGPRTTKTCTFLTRHPEVKKYQVQNSTFFGSRQTIGPSTHFHTYLISFHFPNNLDSRSQFAPGKRKKSGIYALIKYLYEAKIAHWHGTTRRSKGGWGSGRERG